MDSISTDTKLRLVQMIRDENQENRRKMQARENLLGYGYAEPEKETGKQEGSIFLGLRLRIAFAVLFFLFFFILDNTGMSIGNVNAKQLTAWMTEEINISSER